MYDYTDKVHEIGHLLKYLALKYRQITRTRIHNCLYAAQVVYSKIGMKAYPSDFGRENTYPCRLYKVIKEALWLDSIIIIRVLP